MRCVYTLGEPPTESMAYQGANLLAVLVVFQLIRKVVGNNGLDAVAINLQDPCNLFNPRESAILTK